MYVINVGRNPTKVCFQHRSPVAIVYMYYLGEIS